MLTYHTHSPLLIIGTPSCLDTPTTFGLGGTSGQSYMRLCLETVNPGLGLRVKLRARPPDIHHF